MEHPKKKKKTGRATLGTARDIVVIKKKRNKKERESSGRESGGVTA